MIAKFCWWRQNSTKIALVFKPNAKNSFRLTYNQAVFGPSALETYVDFPVQIQAPGILDVWLSGQITAQDFNPNQPIEIVGGNGATLPANTTEWPLAVPYGAVAALTLPPLYEGVAASPSYIPLLPLIQISLMVMFPLELLVLFKGIMHLMGVQCLKQLEPLLLTRNNNLMGSWL